MYELVHLLLATHCIRRSSQWKALKAAGGAESRKRKARFSCCFYGSAFLEVVEGCSCWE